VLQAELECGENKIPLLEATWPANKLRLMLSTLGVHLNLGIPAAAASDRIPNAFFGYLFALAIARICLFNSPELLCQSAFSLFV
jgi:hypothetical protein